jgi:two-component system, NarL family, response regulator LiaR
MAVSRTRKLSTRAIRLVVADERRLNAEALAALIGNMDRFAAKGVVAGAGALGLIVAEKPDLVLIGLGTGSENTLDFVRSIRARAPEVDVVLVADAVAPALVRFVVEEGLSGLLVSDFPSLDLAACLDQVVHGHAVMPAGWHAMLVDDASDSLASLTERQMQVLTLLADGRSYEEIATQLFITVNTVKYHTRSIFLRLGVRNRMAAARLLADHNAPVLH